MAGAVLGCNEDTRMSWASQVDVDAQALGSACTAFPGIVSGSRIGSEAAVTHSGAHLETD